MRVHVIAPFHTVLDQESSHCAFSGKVLRFPDCVLPFGHEVVEYACEGSESSASEKVEVVSRREHDALFPPLDPRNSNVGQHAVIGSPGWRLFDGRLGALLEARVRDGDAVAHPFGRTHQGLVRALPRAVHLETGVGYCDAPFGAFRVFESEAWRHYHWGRWDHDSSIPKDEPGQGRNFSWVVPNYYDPADWPLGRGDGGYALFLGRVDPCKGILVLADVVSAWHRKHPSSPLRFLVAGAGDPSEMLARVSEEARWRVEVLGPVLGAARAPLAGAAACSLMPTQFVEPFGGSGVECMLAGTPLIASDWGAFTETIPEGLGYRCKVLRDWVAAIEESLEWEPVDRAELRAAATRRFSRAACGALYDRCFRQLATLRGAGWYAL